MNQRAEERLIEKLRELPEERFAQVEDFVNFLAGQERRRQAIERLQALRDRLPPDEITEGGMQEIVDAVKEIRTERARAGRP